MKRKKCRKNCTYCSLAELVEHQLKILDAYINRKRLNLIYPGIIFDFEVEEGTRPRHLDGVTITHDIVMNAIETLKYFVPVIKAGNHYRRGLAKECTTLATKCDEVYEKERR